MIIMFLIGRYELIVTARYPNSPYTVETNIIINIVDINDETPIFPAFTFYGNIAENQKLPNTDPVITLEATDSDVTAAFRQVCTASNFVVVYIFNPFLCLRNEEAGGIMFFGCLSIRTTRSRDHAFSRINWWIPAKVGSCMYLAEPKIRCWGHEVTGLIMYAKKLMITLSLEPIDGLPSNSRPVCTFLSQWTD